MENKALRILEFDKILNTLADFTGNESVKKRILNLIPTSDLGEAQFLQNQTNEATSMLLKYGEIQNLTVANITASLKRTSMGSVLTPKELLDIARVLYVSRNAKRYLENGDEEYQILGEIKNALTAIKPLEEQIYMCIISEEEIADNASGELSSIRRKIRNIQGKIKEMLDSVIRSEKYKKYLQDPIVTMRGDRYVIPVRAEYRSEVNGIVHDTSSSGATLFIEPMSVVNANNEIRDLRAKEQAEIERILAALSAEVSEYKDALSANYETICELDFIFCKGRLSAKYGGSEPKLNDKGIIQLKKARHPLIAHKNVVANDIYLGGDFDTLVITGPNTGGKTVTLKTIGLFCIMAACGLHIPANDNSQVAIFDSIWADIGDEQSIEQSLSTFSSHMTNIVNIVNKAGKNSLVLFDELGAGTDPIEGAALAVAILEYLRLAGATTAATTHYSELKLFALSTPGVCNASCEFDVKTLKPTYKLLIGVPGKSNAFAISSKLGLDVNIIERAKSLMSEDNVRFEDLIGDLQESKKVADEEAKKAILLRREADELRDKISTQKQMLEDKRQKMLDEARREAKRIILDAKEESSAVIKELNKLKKNASKLNIDKSVEDARSRLRKKEGALDESFSDVLKKKSAQSAPKTVKVGQSVEVLSFGQVGEVIKEPDNDKNVQVQIGVLKVTVKLSDLRLAEKVNEKKNKKQEQKAYVGYVSKKMDIKTEIDLRGMNLEEAMMETDRFIDDAYMAGLTQISIIHGKGTGILRSGISDMLKRHRLVKSHRLGMYGEGEDGVTIAELK
ncbi:MAG: endonuclease MutS2 [Ruminococcaceae bacterium]|nr:endonuclease MutS2 [Oscillospiraceae bacterium]